MNIGTPEKLLTDDQVNLITQRIINNIFTRRWKDYADSGLKADSEAMAALPEPDSGKRLKLIRSVTCRQDEMLRLMKPDGKEDWHLNKDFLQFAEKTDEMGFLKKYKLNSVDPAELGYKEKK